MALHRKEKRTFDTLSQDYSVKKPRRKEASSTNNSGEIAQDDIQSIELNPATCDELRQIFERHNLLWRKFKQLSLEPAETARLELSVGTGNELAAIIVQHRSEPVQQRSIVCWKQCEEKPTFIDVLSGLYLSLQYLLICPFSTPGWSLNIKKSSGITMLKYYRQFILRYTILHFLGTLLNEFIVDFYSAVEEQRLSYLRFNQKKICRRKELNAGESQLEDIDPGRTFLPSSFLGSKSHPRQMIADALAIVSRFGNPSYFITITCNPRWKEIVERLHPGQNASHRPEVVAQVFKAKFKQFQEVLPHVLKRFGKIYKIHVIEFQKRGLPHAHVAIKVQRESKTGAETDQVIWAELPRNNLELGAKVLEHNILERTNREKFRTPTGNKLFRELFVGKEQERGACNCNVLRSGQELLLL